MITLNSIKKEMVDSIETEKALKEFRKLNEFNAIMFELNIEDEIHWIDKLLMFNVKFYDVLKAHHKNEERLLKVLEQNPAMFQNLKLDASCSEQLIINLLDRENKFFDFELANESIKENKVILSHVLDKKKVYLSKNMEKLIKDDIELYTKYLGHIYPHSILSNDNIQYRWKMLYRWSSNFHGTSKPLLKKTENLEYFLKNYKGFYTKDLLIIMCSNKTFKEKINEFIDVVNLPVEEMRDYGPEIRKAYLIDKIQEHDKNIKAEIKTVSVKRKI